MGLIASGRFLTKKRYDSMRANGVRGMVALHSRKLSHVHTWVFEQSRVGETALNHLAERGHQRVLAIMPLKGDEARYRDDRVAGATRSAKRHGIELKVLRTELDPQRMTQAVTDALRGRRAPTAIYAFNDEYARVAQGALHDLGLRIPDDVALLGSDDGPMATFGWPRLSSVAVASPERWAVVARGLHEVLEGLPVSDSGAMPSLYVVRRDTT